MYKRQHIWQEVLEREKVSVIDNFFELGGHSIKAVNILSRINKEFNMDINIKSIFNYPVLADLATLINFMQKQVDLKSNTFKEIEI